MATISDDIIEQLKTTNYEFATVIGVEYIGNSSFIVCKCECGNIFKKKLHQMKNLSIHCGCKTSFLLSRAFHNKVTNDPTFLKRRGEAYSKWCKEHPEEVAAQGKRHSEKLLSDPDKLAEQGRQHSQWYKYNPDKAKEKAKKNSQWYKDNPEKVAERSEKYKQWCINNPDKVKEKVNKYKQWCTENILANQHRGDNISSNKYESRLNMISEFSQDELLKIHPDDLKLILDGTIKGKDTLRIKCSNCNNYDYHRFDTSISLKNKSVTQRLCNKCCLLGKSKYEDELYNYITSLGCTCIRHDRSILNGKELDLYYPEKQIAIEFNGLYWHDINHKPKDYHFNKFKECKEHNIRLISIFEQDWIHNKDKILSLLNNSFITPKYIYARRCKINVLEDHIKRDFINKYHFSGDISKHTISYGLYYNNDLVSVMTFRNITESKYELIRFCTKDNYKIIGGASKLFSHFIKEYKPTYILCYSDNDFFSGDVYKQLGFTLKSLGEKSIDYQWCTIDECLSRYQCMPYKLLQKYPEYSNITIDGSKEDYIMNDLGYCKIYRCGNSIWEWKADN